MTSASADDEALEARQHRVACHTPWNIYREAGIDHSSCEAFLRITAQISGELKASKGDSINGRAEAGAHEAEGDSN